MTKKTLCLALCALVAGKATANGGYWNSASVSGTGGAAAAVDGIAVAGAGTVSVSTAAANDKVQGSNTLTGSGALVDGYEGVADSYGSSGAGAGTSNYNGMTGSASDSYARADFDEWFGPASTSNGNFGSGATGSGITAAMGGQATVAVAEESYDDDWWGTVGTAGAIGVSGSKARQGQDSPHSIDMLFALDDALDTMTDDEFESGAEFVLESGPELLWVGRK